MKNGKYILTVAVFSVILLTLASNKCLAEGMIDLYSDIDISSTTLHEWMPNPEYNSIDNEFLVLWHSTGVREEGGENMYSLHAQRVSSNGKLLGEPLSPVPDAGTERRLTPRAVYNPFKNQYMVAFVMGRELSDWDPFVIILDHDGSAISDAIALSEDPGRQNHITISFNSIRREFLVAYNDSRNGNADIFGVIVDEDGSIVREEFIITSAEGDQINPQSCYNSTDDTYLFNWEDFRHVTVWTEPANVYGALLDGDGNVMVNDIAMVEDYGMEDERDQRHNKAVYNPDKNEFLACWMDSSLSKNEVDVYGRIYNADGTPAGQAFKLIDGPGAQVFPEISYIKEKKMHFATWDDSRNDDPDTYWRDTVNWDTYAKWINSSGESVGADFPVIVKERNQRYGRSSYNPLMDRMLIVWRDEVDEEVLAAGGSGHIVESGGNIVGKIHGTPAFIIGRVVEQGTGNPVENAKAVIIGFTLPVIKTTNTGGWFNIAKTRQPEGTYFMIIYKSGYAMAVESITYTGDPIELTVEIAEQ
jgi:hypothetical protein